MTPSVASIDNQNILNKNNIFNEGSPARTEGTKSLVKSKYSVKTASNHQKSRDVEMQEDIEEIDANSIILMKPIMRDKSTQCIHFDNQEKVIENIDKEINISEQNIRFKSQMQINMERLYTLNEVDEEFKSHVSDIKGVVEDYTQTDIVETFTKEVETDPVIFTNSVIQPQNEQSQKTSLFKKFKLATVNPLNIADSKPKIRIESDEFDQKDSDVHTDLSKFPLLSGLSKINEQNLDTNQEYQPITKNKESTSNLIQLPSVYYPKIDEVKLQSVIKSPFETQDLNGQNSFRKYEKPKSSFKQESDEGIEAIIK